MGRDFGSQAWPSCFRSFLSRHPLTAKPVSPKKMGRDGKTETHLVPYVNTWFWPSCSLVGMSSLFFGVYIGKVTNSHEWKELFLDYCDHKRTVMCPNPPDNVARTFLRILKIAPK